MVNAGRIYSRNDFELYGEEERAERSKRDFSHLLGTPPPPPPPPPPLGPPQKKRDFVFFFLFSFYKTYCNSLPGNITFFFFLNLESRLFLLACVFTIRDVAYIVPSWVACCIKRVPIKIEGGRGRRNLSYSSTFFFQKERKIWVLILLTCGT